MAQLMQGCGLNRWLRLPWADQHGHLGLQLPTPLPLHLHQFQDSASVAGAVVESGRPASLDNHLSAFGLINQGDGEVALPGVEGLIHRLKPALLPDAGGPVVAHRFDPHTPMGLGWPAGRGGFELVAIVR